MATAIVVRDGTPFDQLTHRPPSPAPRRARHPAPTLPPPARTVEQRLQALQRANDIRVKRAETKRNIKAGRVSVVDLLVDPPAEFATMTAYELLMAIPLYGQVKVTKILARSQISRGKTLAGLSPRQRAELADLFRNPQR